MLYLPWTVVIRAEKDLSFWHFLGDFLAPIWRKHLLFMNRCMSKHVPFGCKNSVAYVTGKPLSMINRYVILQRFLTFEHFLTYVTRKPYPFMKEHVFYHTSLFCEHFLAYFTRKFYSLMTIHVILQRVLSTEHFLAYVTKKPFPCLRRHSLAC